MVASGQIPAYLNSLLPHFKSLDRFSDIVWIIFVYLFILHFGSHNADINCFVRLYLFVCLPVCIGQNI